jgi:outer membrane protein OmpA-like peptidoglycan-associated protein
VRIGRTLTVQLAALAAALAVGCAPKKAPAVVAPPPSGQTLIVLMPDDENGNAGRTGRVTVTNSSGTVELAASHDSTLTTPSQAPAAVTRMSEADVKRQFGTVLSALPPAPRHFVLFFKFESDELTDGSRALVPEVLKTVKDRAFPEVAVVGHTDTMGQPQANIELGLKRATFVRNLLIEVGLDAKLIEVTSHGEVDQLISTPDTTPESRNRRVEIVVR